jgi:molybdenum cofactor synthesis domain-containing protein
MPSAEIITIGTEILLGEIVDTNTRFIARTLRGLGVDLFRTTTIGDNTARIVEAIQESMRRADIVITTGGLGPTVDDPTREAVARALGVDTEFREDLWQQVRKVIARYGRLPTENQKRQAYVPRGAIAIENPVGTAPSFIVEFPFSENSHREEAKSAKEDLILRGEKTGAIISLPGVPQEMEVLFHRSVIPYLQKKFDLREIIKVRVLHTSGMSEGAIDEHVGEFEQLANPTVGLAAHTGVVDIRIAAKADSETEADRLIAEVETQIRDRLGEAIFGADEDTLEGVTLRAAASRGWDVVVLESGLDGSLARRLSAARPANLSALDSVTLGPGELADQTRQSMQAHSAKAALGVALFASENEQVIEQLLITPEGEQSRRLTYGGPPKYAPRWAGNLALNWLRQTANKKA